MKPPASPYEAPGFYDRALAEGRHRDIVGGRWDETGRLQMSLLQAEGMEPRHRLLDVGAGALRLGCRAVPWLEPGNYWATDASGALMRRGHEVELAASPRLPPDRLIEDADFAFPGVPDGMDYVIAFAVFTHLPPDRVARGLTAIAARFGRARAILFTLFLAPDGVPGALRQPDGVVTHPDRPPYHLTESGAAALIAASGLRAERRAALLPRGQVLFVARPHGDGQAANHRYR